MVFFNMNFLVCFTCIQRLSSATIKWLGLVWWMLWYWKRGLFIVWFWFCFWFASGWFLCGLGLSRLLYFIDTWCFLPFNWDWFLLLFFAVVSCRFDFCSVNSAYFGFTTIFKQFLMALRFGSWSWVGSRVFLWTLNFLLIWLAWWTSFVKFP